MIKSLLVALNTSPPAQAALKAACWLGSAAQGKIYLVHVIQMPMDPALTTGMMAGSLDYTGGVGGETDPEELEVYRQRRKSEGQEMMEAASGRCRAVGVTCEGMCLMGYPEEELLRRADSVDLLAIGKHDVAERGHKIGRLTEGLIRGGAQPGRVTEAGFEPPDQVMVLYDGDDKGVHVLGLAAEVSRLTGLPMTVVTAGREEAEAKAVNERALSYLGDHEVEAESEVLAADESTDRLLLKWVLERPMGLVMMGAFGSIRVKEWLLGSTTRTMLRQTPNPTLLVRH